MGISFFPLHVWDRELDSRIILASLLASSGEHIIFGHEYNMASIYGLISNAFWLHNGRPTDTYRSRDWRRPIKKNGGHTALIYEEGMNDLSKKATERNLIGVNTESLALVDKMYAWTEYEKSLNLESLPLNVSTAEFKQKTTVCGNTRIELLGTLGRSYYKKRADALKTLFGDYVLVSDNFGIEAFGTSAPVDQTKRYMEITGSADKANELNKEHINTILINKKVRDHFCNVVNALVAQLPAINFIIRPHPVADHRYWHIGIKPARNVTILYKDSIEPWIFSSTCVIHSGCTVGLQAEMADVRSIDIGSLVSDTRTPKALSRCHASHRPSSLDELSKLVKEEFKKGDMQTAGNMHIKEIPSIHTQGVVDLLTKNMSSLNTELMNLLANSIGLPLISAALLQAKEFKTFRSSNPCIVETDFLNKISSTKLGMIPPNANKSRKYAISDIAGRFNAALTALNIKNNIFVQKLKAPNVFLVGPCP